MKQETFEKKLEHAKEILERLAQPDITLEEAVKLYEEGTEVIKSAQKMLEEAKAKVEIIRRQNQEDEA